MSNKPGLFFRSFFIQTNWNYKWMVSQGLTFCILPSLKKVIKGKNSLKDILLNHLNFFNSHPFLTSYIIGMVVKTEEEGGINNINDYKAKLGNALGSVGDRFFWKYLKPFSVIIGIITIFILKVLFPYNIIIGLSIFLLTFNIPMIITRYYGLKYGYKWGTQISNHLPIALINNLNRKLVIIGLLLLGILCAFEMEVYLNFNITKIIIFMLSASVTFILNYKKTLINFSLIIPLGVTFLLVFLMKILNI